MPFFHRAAPSVSETLFRDAVLTCWSSIDNRCRKAATYTVRALPSIAMFVAGMAIGGSTAVAAQPLPPANVGATPASGPETGGMAATPGLAVTRFIRVTGYGVVRSKPGIARVVFLVSSSDPYPVKALDDNSKKVAKVVAELVNRGVPRANVVSSESSLVSPTATAASTTATVAGAGGTAIDTPSGAITGTDTGQHYTADARVEVTTYDITHATQIVQIGMYGGAVAVLGMHFEPGNIDDLKAQALVAAMKDAYSKARVLAAGANVRILYPISVSELPATAPEPPGMAMAPPAQVVVPMDIEVTYAIG